jgi:hypothetical protein
MAAKAPRALILHAAALLAVTALAACSDPPSAADLPGDAGMGRLELGKGELEFAELADGEALPYVAGTQGGHHVFVSFRVQALDPERVLIEVTTQVEDYPELVLTRRGRQTFMHAAVAADAGADAPASYEYAGWPAQILDAPLHVGASARIDVMLEDRTGRTARATKTVVIGNAAL